MTHLRKVYIADPETGTMVSVRGLKDTDTTGAINTHDLDNHRRWLEMPFLKYTGNIESTTIPITSGDISITVSNGLIFTVNDSIAIYESAKQEYMPFFVVDVNGDVLTLNRPIDNDYAVGANVEIVEKNMAVAGTISSPQIFKIKIPTGVTIHIDSITINIVDPGTPDDSTFGSIVGGLQNGITLREKKPSGDWTLVNWRTNADIRNSSGDNLTFIEKGDEGIGARFSVKELTDNIIEINGTNNEELWAYVQDDLTLTNNVALVIKGHFADK